jgi:hypothetical protein
LLETREILMIWVVTSQCFKTISLVAGFWMIPCQVICVSSDTFENMSIWMKVNTVSPFCFFLLIKLPYVCIFKDTKLCHAVNTSLLLFRNVEYSMDEEMCWEMSLSCFTSWTKLHIVTMEVDQAEKSGKCPQGLLFVLFAEVLSFIYLFNLRWQ